MKYSYYMGVDISKLTFDFTLIDSEGTILWQGAVENKEAAIRAWICDESEQEKLPDFWSDCLVCLEHSGYYAAPLLRVLNRIEGLDIWLESALQIKRSIGVQRGKSDKVDAERIASYCIDFQGKARIWKPIRKNIERLGLLLSHRDRMVKNLMSIRTTLKEEEGFVDMGLHEEMVTHSEGAIAAMELSVSAFEEQIARLLKTDEDLARINEIVQSLPGFGPVIAPKLIEVTHGFTRLTDPRAFACYAGVAPFEHSSGTSIRGKTRVSHLANKDIKKMLHLAALVTIRKKNIMHGFFQRKVAEGKNKMSIINAVRNKLIHILYACIRNNTTYDRNYAHSLA